MFDDLGVGFGFRADGVNGRDREYVAFDLETTGLMVESDRVVEVGAVRFAADGRELGRFDRLVHPGRPMSPAAQAVHGISDADLAGAPPAADVLPEFLAFLGDPELTTLLAHNAGFDAGFLGRELARLGTPSPGHAVADTLALSRVRLPTQTDHRLDTLARLFGLDTDDAHRALADGLRVRGLWLALGGHGSPAGTLIAYPIADPTVPGGATAPLGWGTIAEAIALGRTVRLEYAGGTRGDAPRSVTPRAFVRRGGVPYLLARCHIDDFEKSFRLDRIARYEVVLP